MPINTFLPYAQNDDHHIPEGLSPSKNFDYLWEKKPKLRGGKPQCKTSPRTTNDNVKQTPMK